MSRLGFYFRSFSVVHNRYFHVFAHQQSPWKINSTEVSTISAMEGLLKLDYFHPDRVPQEMPPPAIVEKYPRGTAILVTRNGNEEQWKVQKLLRGNGFGARAIWLATKDDQHLVYEMMMQGHQGAVLGNIGSYSQMTDEHNRPTHPFGVRNNIGRQQRKKAPISVLQGLLNLDYFDPDRMQQEGASGPPPLQKDIEDLRMSNRCDLCLYSHCQCGLLHPWCQL